MIAQVAINDNSFFFIILMSTALLLVFVGFFIAFIQFYRRRQLEFQNEQNQREQAFSEELVRSQLEIREKVMRQISDELHDNIGQSLIVAKMQLSSLNPEKSTIQVVTAHEIIGRSLKDLRSISKTLNGNYILREGLYKALENEIRVINSSNKLECVIEGNRPNFHFSAKIEVIVFRCIQEVLSNAIKHSNAKQIVLRFGETQKTVILDIRDNGEGMPKDWKNRRGLGMDNIEKRVAMIGGKFKIESVKGNGTRIKFILPKIPHLG